MRFVLIAVALVAYYFAVSGNESLVVLLLTAYGVMPQSVSDKLEQLPQRECIAHPPHLGRGAHRDVDQEVGGARGDLLIELVQSQQIERTAEWKDLGVDVAGIVIGLTLARYAAVPVRNLVEKLTSRVSA